MNDILIRIARRIKKNIIWIIAVPIILGAAGYILPSQIADQKSYTAEDTLAVGSYDHPVYNSTEEIPLLLKSDSFLKEALPDEKDEDVAEIKEKLAYSFDHLCEYFSLMAPVSDSEKTVMF